MSDCVDCPEQHIEGHVPTWLAKNVMQAMRYGVLGLWPKTDAHSQVSQVKFVLRSNQAEMQINFADSTPVQIIELRDEPRQEEAEA